MDNVLEGEIQVPYKPCIAHFCLLTPTNRVKKKRKILVHLLCAAVRADVRSPGVECALTVARGGKKNVPVALSRFRLCGRGHHSSRWKNNSGQIFKN